MKIAALWRYPVKGLSAEPLSEAHLTKGGYFPCDRLFAIENGPSGFDPDDPKWIAKIRFLMLMRNERLAGLSTRYDEATSTLSVAVCGREIARSDLSTSEGRAALEAFLSEFCRDELRGTTRVLVAPEGFRFTDARSGFVSLINRASVEDLARRLGRPVDPRRFRGNVLVEGLDAWAEFDLIGATLRAGGARLVVTKRIERCVATNVDPDTGRRDLEIPRSLMSLYGHTDCGIYLRVAQSGAIAIGDRIEIESSKRS
jgi:hypothetical protein